MSIVDERGRLFGRFNLIDASVVAVVVLLLPIAVAAYMLFRPPPMKITSVTPNRVEKGSNVYIRLAGEHFRPYLRAEVGRVQPRRFLIETPTAGEISLPDLEPGTYDVALFDEAEEVARMKDAVTVVAGAPPPTIKMQLVGTFTNLTEAAAKSLKPGQRFPEHGDAAVEVVSTAPPAEDVRRVRMSPLAVDVPVPGSWRVAATVRVGCVFNFANSTCAVNGAPMAPGFVLPVANAGQFLVDDVHADSPGVAMEIAVRFVGRPEVLDLMKAGDVDKLAAGGGGARAARVASVASRQTVSGETSMRVLPSQQPIEVTTQTADRVTVVEALIRLAADPGPDGPVYRGGVIKPGSFFTFDSQSYVAQGTIFRSTLVSK